MALAKDDVARWLAQAQAGSAEALGYLMQACQDYLLLLAHHELPAALQGKGGASDLVQETFVQAVAHFPQFRGTTEAEFRGWLRQILVNNLANFQRHYRGTDKRQADREVALEGRHSSLEYVGGLAADQPSPSSFLNRQEQAQALQQAMDRLPADYRQVLLLRHQEGLSFEEIGRLMGRSANAAEKLWARAVLWLRQDLGTLR
jgi:RNA polymerase sigma-70 factor (ECF subfamily)